MSGLNKMHIFAQVIDVDNIRSDQVFPFPDQLQAFLDFRGFNFHSFGFNTV